MKFQCHWIYPECAYEAEDNDHENLVDTADAHLQKNHPAGAVERARVEALIRSGAGPVA